MKPLLLSGVLSCVAIILMLLHISLGPIDIHIGHALQQLFVASPDASGLILKEIRIPRVLLAFFVGISLGLSGAALQGLLKNPLAGSDLIGVSSCAALGAVIALYFGFASMAWYVLPFSGMLGSGLCVILIFLLAGKQCSSLNLILAGVAINAVASSFIALALNYADNPYAMNEMIYWLLGSVTNRSINDIVITLPFMGIGWVLLLMSGRFLNALSLGEETATSLGFNVNRYRILIVLGVTFCVGAAVSVSGNIGFIGLVVPHLLRPFVNSEPAKLLPLSALGGGVLLLAADCVVQIMSTGTELKLGVVTSIVGGPFFLLLIYKMRNEAF